MKALEKSRDSTAQAREITRQCNIAPSLTGAKLNHATGEIFLVFFFFSRSLSLFSNPIFDTRSGGNIVTSPKGADPKGHGDRWTVVFRILQGAFSARDALHQSLGIANLRKRRETAASIRIFSAARTEECNLANANSRGKWLVGFRLLNRLPVMVVPCVLTPTLTHISLKILNSGKMTKSPC